MGKLKAVLVDNEHKVFDQVSDEYNEQMVEEYMKSGEFDRDLERYTLRTMPNDYLQEELKERRQQRLLASIKKLMERRING